MFRGIRSATVALVATMLGACGGGGDASNTTSPVNGNLAQPTPINLYPSQGASEGARLIVMITSVGSAAVNLPVIFDTGSAGVTLYAPAVFPASMVSASGFVFAAGQTSLTYNGITVTNQQGTRTYGTTDPRAQNGNIGYATLAFGDSQGQLTTATLPVFFYYSITDVTTGALLPPPVTQGVFGVASTVGTIAVSGSTEPAAGYPACSMDTNGTCVVASVLKYLQYGAGVNAGFVLGPATIQSCDITTPGNCSPAPVLTVGLNATLESGFSTVSLTCPPSGYTGPASVAGYPVCQKNIANTIIGVSGNSVGTVTGAVLFDTGTTLMQIATAAGSNFPTTVAPGSSALVTTPSGFAYSYVATASGVFDTVVNPDTVDPSIVGIGYFTSHSFFVDFSSSSEGWK